MEEYMFEKEFSNSLCYADCVIKSLAAHTQV